MEEMMTMEQHEMFEKLMKSENERLADEDKRLSKRLDVLEIEVRNLAALATSVERLATSMESMAKEQEKQGKRLEMLEVRDEVTGISLSVERISATIEHAAKIQAQNCQRLDELEGRDGEMWRKVVGHLLTTAAGILIGYLFMRLGIN